MELRLLGRAEILNSQGHPVKLRSAKVLELLAYLALHGEHGASRSELAHALWPDMPPERQRPNLRQTLLYTRKLSPDLVVEVGDVLRLDESVSVDAWKIEDPVPSDVERLRAVVALYRGPLLSGTDAAWAAPHREQYAQRHLAALLRLSELCREEDPAESLSYAEAAILEDPLQEAPRLAQVLALRASGEHAKAVEAVEKYRALVSAELRIDASASLLRAAGVERASEGKGERFNRAAMSPVQLLQHETARAPDYLVSGRLAEGRRRLVTALQRVHSQTDEKSRGWAALSRLDYEAGDYQSAYSHAQMAETESRNRRSLLLAEVAMARAHLGYGRFSQAGAILASIRKRMPAEELEMVAEALLLSSLVAYFEHRAKEALRLALRGLRLAEEAESPYLQMTCLNAAGSSLFKLDRLDEALTHLMRALRIAETKHMPLRAGHLGATVGRIIEAQGDLEGARERYERSYVMFEGGESPTYQAMTGTYLAELALKAGDAAGALEWHRKCFALRRTTGDRLGVATSLRGMGRAYLEMRRPQDAEEHLLSAIRLYDSLFDEFGTATCNVPLALALWQEGDTAGAIATLDKAERVLLRYADRISESFEDKALTPESLLALRAMFEGDSG